MRISHGYEFPGRAEPLAVRISYHFAEPGAPRTEVAPGVLARLPGTATFTGEMGGRRLTVVMELEMSLGKIGARTITVAAEDGRVTGADLRAVRVQDLIRQVVLDQVLVRGQSRVLDDSSRQVTQWGMWVSGPPESLREEGPTDRALQWVAFFYRVATALGDPPAKVVEQSLRLPTSTAGYWIRRAKDRGLIDGER